MALPVLDDNGSPLRGVLSFYSNQNINGSFDRMPHIVLTITPSQMSESSGARQGWAEFISKAVEEGRVLSYDKEKGSVLSVIAQQARLGNITEASLTDSITRFKKSVKDFKEKNKIYYDLAPSKTVTRTNSDNVQVIEESQNSAKETVFGKRDLAPKKSTESADKGDAAFERAKGQMYKREADEARKQTAEARRDAMSLAQQIARDAYETDAKTFTQKEIDALIGRINQYSTDEFKDIMDEKKATISKIDKEQFAYDIYVAFHLASADKRVMDRMNVLADRLAGNKKALAGFLYYFVNSSVILFSTLGAPSGTSYPTSAGAAQ